MAGASAARNFTRTALAVGLCFLAFGFAMEAKMAWFNRVGGLGCEIAAAKARPADLPAVVAHGAPAPDPGHPQILFVFLAACSAAFSWKPDALPGRKNLHNDLAVSSAAYFSPNLFFRPPPVR